MASSRIQKFLSTAYSYYKKGTKESGGANRYKAGTPLAEIFGIFGAAPGTMWCAIFVYACAYKAGMTPALLKKDSSTSYAAGICYNVVAKGGKWIPGPYKTRSAVKPQPGDLILYNNSKYHMTYAANGKVTGWHGSHVGIVYSVSGSQVTTIEGNVSNKVSVVKHKLNDSSIGGYARPKWSSSDLSYLGIKDQSLTQLYKIENDRHDMTMRQVGYLDGSFNPTDTPTGLALSVINYTSVLGDLYEMFAPVQPDSKVNVSTGKLSGNAKIAMDYFLKLECTATAAAALTGCLQAYSVIDPNYFHFVQNTALYGIAAWDIIRINEVKQWLGEDWNTNLSGQLEFFLHDIETNFTYIVQILKTQELGKDNVENVIDIFMPVYNTKRNSGNFITLAKSFAKDIYSKLIITKPTTVGNSTVLRNRNGKQLTAKKSVAIPSSLPQTGIIDDYTSYSAWFSRWNGQSPQKKLANIWKGQGFPCNKGIATIGGYYCVAVSPKFGACGDVLVVTLAGGITFPAIICDIKGNDAKSDWGHKKPGGKIAVIEWQRVKTKNGKVVTGNIGFSNVDKCGFTGWLGKKVVNITNYGKYDSSIKWG